MIRIPRKILAFLFKNAQTFSNTEICGLLSCDEYQKIQNCFFIKNIALDKKNYFLFDTRQYISTLKKMREKKEDLFAIFHSHLNSPANLSALDFDYALNFENVLHLIISLNTQGVLEMRCFKIESQKIIELELILID